MIKYHVKQSNNNGLFVPIFTLIKEDVFQCEVYISFSLYPRVLVLFVSCSCLISTSEHQLWHFLTKAKA